MIHKGLRQAAALMVVALLVVPTATPVAMLSAATASNSPSSLSGDTVTIPATGLTDDQKILHALNRLGYGPRPGDIERVRRLGVEKWIEQQLVPDTIPDHAAEAILASFSTLNLSQTELMIKYPPPQMQRRLLRRLTSTMGMDSDASGGMFPEAKAAQERRERRERREQRDQQKSSQPTNSMVGGNDMSAPAMTNPRGERGRQSKLPTILLGSRRIIAELSQARLVRALHSERQLQEVMTDFWFNHFNVFAERGVHRWMVGGFERDVIRPNALGRFRDLLGATARHPAMLMYLDNWQSADPNADQLYIRLSATYRIATRKAGLSAGGVAAEVLRERGLAAEDIERMLPNMEVRPSPRSRQTAPARRNRLAAQQNARRPARSTRPTRRKRGLNENYARELLELHTLGVDGGYTEQDVREVARCFTGWSLTPLLYGHQPVYANDLHDRGTKRVLGQKIGNSGQGDGERVLDLLARHPSTARFISLKLARRFVSDHPPEKLVDAMAETFLQTDGNIREVLRTLFRSKQFWSPDVINTKFKTPLTFVVSAARALGLRPEAVDRIGPGTFLEMVSHLTKLGQRLYGAQPPTGYSEAERVWVSTGGMLHRFKIASTFVVRRIGGSLTVEEARWMRADSSTYRPEFLASAELALLGRKLSSTSRDALLGEVERIRLESGGRNLRVLNARNLLGSMVASWILASPDFQRH